jgi:hypothetical protein
MSTETSNDNIFVLNPLNAELNPIRHLLALAGAHHFVDVSRIRVHCVERIGALKLKRKVLEWETEGWRRKGRPKKGGWSKTGN